ncbi:MAG TPA: LEA type 2 family protein, partial [Anaeromyxobacteraceae bacterium]
MRTPRPLLAALALLALSGCAALNRIAASAFEKPRLTFRTATLQQLDLEGATLGFEFDLENPNSFGLSVARLGYGVELEGTRVATGEMPGGLQIPAAGRTPVTFPVRIRYRDVPGIVSLLGKQRDAIGYRLSGTVGVKTPVGVVDLPMSHAATLPLPRLPAFALDGLAIRSVSLSQVALDLK